MLKKILWVADLVLAFATLYMIGWCVGDYIGNKIPFTWESEE